LCSSKGADIAEESNFRQRGPVTFDVRWGGDDASSRWQECALIALK
jgi:hypothetical protein